MSARARYLYIEPFDAGSHAAFGRWLLAGVDADWTALTMPGRHWKWRMRGAPLWLARQAEFSAPFDALFASSYVALAELRGLVPSLSATPAVLYFHENQFAFPVRREHVGGPDYQYAFTQLVSCLAADAVAFNSAFNRDTFLDGARDFVRRMPDCTDAAWVDDVAARAHVLPLPVDYPECVTQSRNPRPLVLWNHRWEHDKNPDAFFAALRTLVDAEVAFDVAVLGQRFGKWPAVFDDARSWLGERVVAWGPVDRAAYVGWLSRADVCVSTANHEFFGVSVLEAAHCGARPLVPDRLAYRETIPSAYRYADDSALPGALKRLLDAWWAGETLRGDHSAFTARYASVAVAPRYAELLQAVAKRGRK